MPASSSRFAWVDNLRTWLIVLVVNIHACVTYSHVGGWYFKEGVEPGIAVKFPFLLWMGHLQAFFMGLLFLLAGYFAELSAQRKTTGTFLRERFWRLGVPLLLYVFVLHPLMVWGINPYSPKSPPLGRWYRHFLSSGDFLSTTGPLWFAAALLIFCVVFIFVRGGGPKNESAAREAPSLRVRAGFVLGLMLALSTITFLVRLVAPIGTSVLNFQLCYFPQYLVAFLLGVWLARRRGLNAVAASPVARRFGWVTLVAGPLVLTGVLGAMTWQGFGWRGPAPIFGGLNLLALGYAFWEQCAGVGLGLGAMALTFALMNRETAFTRWASARSFAVYVLHAPILLALTTAMRGWSDNPFLMTAIATVAALIASFAAADLVLRIPGVKRIF